MLGFLTPTFQLYLQPWQEKQKSWTQPVLTRSESKYCWHKLEVLVVASLFTVNAYLTRYLFLSLLRGKKRPKNPTCKEVPTWYIGNEGFLQREDSCLSSSYLLDDGGGMIRLGLQHGLWLGAPQQAGSFYPAAFSSLCSDATSSRNGVRCDTIEWQVPLGLCCCSWNSYALTHPNS